jgi:hypothetical protein
MDEIPLPQSIELLLQNLRAMTPAAAPPDASADCVASIRQAAATVQRLSAPGAPRDEDALDAVVRAMHNLNLHAAVTASILGACVYRVGGGKGRACAQLSESACQNITGYISWTANKPCPSGG